MVGMIKVFLTVLKYSPQVAMNYWCQSTAGFSIGAVLLDLAGASLSLMQLVLDSSLQGNWSGALGNTAKLLLGNISLLFDLVFIFQHFVLYRERKPGPSERDPLLDRRPSTRSDNIDSSCSHV
jgi:cystinosin